jgi:hypothetical protein
MNGTCGKLLKQRFLVPIGVDRHSLHVCDFNAVACCLPDCHLNSRPLVQWHKEQRGLVLISLILRIEVESSVILPVKVQHDHSLSQEEMALSISFLVIFSPALTTICINSH